MYILLEARTLEVIPKLYTLIEETLNQLLPYEKFLYYKNYIQ